MRRGASQLSAAGGGPVSEIFGSTYADTYDLLYGEKDYAAECDLIEHLFQTYCDDAVRKVIDFGCGTGNHAVPLVQRGYQVTGVDRSANMLAHARQKAAGFTSNGDATFEQGDIRNVNLERAFDAGLMMFAVLSYQLENVDVRAALKTARNHLRTGALLIFDVWYGPAVLRQRPAERIKVIPTSNGQVLRFVRGELNSKRQLCTVDIHLWRLAENRLVADLEEVHSMRYFFPLELELFLEIAGFSLIRLGAFPQFERDPDESTWNILGVARAC